MKKSGVLPDHHIIGVETGGCPHTAIREDISMNIEAAEELTEKIDKLDLIFIESGGDNLAAAFSQELADVFLYIIDVAQGEDIPRKGGPGIKQSDLLIVNKIDLAPYVGVNLHSMESRLSKTTKRKIDRFYQCKKRCRCVRNCRLASKGISWARRKIATWE